MHRFGTGEGTAASVHYAADTSDQMHAMLERGETRGAAWLSTHHNPTKKDNPTMKSVLKLQRHLQVQRQPCPGGTYSSSQGQVACNTCPQGEAVCILLLLCSLLLL